MRVRSNFYNYRYVIVLLIFLLVIGATFYFIQEERKLFESQQQLAVVQKVSSVRAALEKAVNERLYTITALAAYVTINGGEVKDEEFNTLSSALLTDQFRIRSVQLAPDGVVTYVAPLEGNEAAVGHNLLVDDRGREAVRRAIDTNSYIIAGPIELIQGGTALIARQPVYLPEDLGPFGSGIVNRHGAFWGFATLLIDLDVLIETANIDYENFDVAVRGKDGLGAQGDVFLGNPSVFEGNPVVQEVILPNGTWQVAANPAGGWADKALFSFVVWFIALLFAASISALFLFVLSQPRLLERQVKEATEKLKSKNDELERSRKATLNILEDVQEEKDRVKTILNSIGDGVFVVDRDLTIQAINPVALSISGISSGTDSVIGKPYKEVLKFIYEETNKVNDKFVINAIRTGEVQEMSNHTLLVKPGGERIPVADSAAPLKDAQGNVRGCVVVFRDVSKEYAIDKAKTEFVSLASHQLRTPLSAINWNMEMLVDDLKDKLPEEERQYFDDVYASSKRMTELVGALLNVSRIELGTFSVDPEQTDIIKLSRDIVKDLQSRIDEKNLHLVEKYNPESFVMNVDPKLMRMVVENLLSNAVKYTPNDKEISLTIEKKNKNIVIEVRDQGYGIPEGQKDKIFTRLFRADNVRNKDVEGTGLGLYIIKSIIEHSGGTIKFVSKEDEGTTFYVTMPISGMDKKEGSRKML